MYKNVNDDFKKGIRFLLKSSRENRFNVKKYEWVLPFSLKLSELNICEKFWHNTVEQGNLTNISMCKNVQDIFHGRGADATLFLWNRTKEGYRFWRNVDAKLFGDYDDFELYQDGSYPNCPIREFFFK